MVSSVVNLCARCTTFWTKTFDISSWFITYNSISLCWLHKRSCIIIWWKNSWSAYPTLKNDSHTPRNTVSSMVNVCIRYVIFWTKRGIFSQCEISPVGFITCTPLCKSNGTLFLDIDIIELTSILHKYKTPVTKRCILTCCWVNLVCIRHLIVKIMP